MVLYAAFQLKEEIYMEVVSTVKASVSISCRLKPRSWRLKSGESAKAGKKSFLSQFVKESTNRGKNLRMEHTNVTLDALGIVNLGKRK